MKTFYDPSNPANLVDEDDEPRAQPRKGTGKGRTTRKEVRETPSRPPEVSEDVWVLAQQWITEGEKKFGRRPPVNTVNFAVSFSEKINSTWDLRKWVQGPDEKWERTLWNSGQEFVVDVISRMIRMFYDHLTEDQTRESAQFDFLHEEWDEWVYQALTSAQVSEYQAHGTWTPTSGKYKPLDRSTIGKPRDEDPCTDPDFSGMTWGQVRALDADEPRGERDFANEEPEPERKRGSLARPKRDRLANREATTTEEDSDVS